MAQTAPILRIGKLLKEEKKEIYTVYFYALLSGLIQLSLPLGIQSIIGFVLGGALSASLVILIALVVLGVAFNGLLQMNQLKYIERIQQKIFVRYSLAFSTHLGKLDLQKTSHIYLPELVNRFFDVPVLQKSLSKILLDFPLAITQILLGLMLLAFYHPVFIFFGILLISLLILIFYVSGSKGVETSLIKSKYKYAVAAWLQEVARVIKPFKFSEPSELHQQKTDEKVIQYVEARKEHFSVLLVQYKVLIAFKVIITAAMLIVGCALLLDQQLTIGQFVAAEIVIIIVINSVEKLIVNLDSVYSALTSVEKINTLLDKPTEAGGNYASNKTSAPSIEFSNVSFAYDDARPILEGFSMKVNSGEKICLTGADGSGKSTVLKLLTGAYPQFNGSLLINDISIGNYSLESLRINTGILLGHQDVFAGSLWQNITVGNLLTDIDYVNELATAVGLSAFIATLKKGYDTELDPTGKRLPSSVVQKILLVRALAQKPTLLLLEDPWRGFDEKTKDGVQQLLLSTNATILIATNDQQFIERCTKHIKMNLTN